MLTIGLEATRANKDMRTGTEWYAWHILQQLKKIDRENKYIVYYNQTLNPELAEGPANFYFQQLKWRYRKFWTHIRLGKELRKNPVDIFLATNAVPFLMKQGKIVVTIHDLGFYVNPQLYHPLERIYQNISHKLAIRQADKIIAISEATKQDIIKYFPKAENKIKVIYDGWNSQDFVPSNKENKDKILYKFDLPENFILYTGRLESKKNIQCLIKAFKLLNTNWSLVLAGRAGNYGYKEIEALAKDPEIKDRVILLSYVSQKYYTSLVAAANIYAFPTKFEGFGITVLEAMGSGVPVACSDLSVLHEVGGKAAVFFDPDNPQDMAGQLQKLIDNPELRQELSKKGIEQAKKFSWEKCTQETLDYILDKKE